MIAFQFLQIGRLCFLLTFQNEILRMIANGDSLVATVRQICIRLEEKLPGVVCTVLSVDSGGLLHPLAAPSLPDDFCQAINGLMIGPEVGSCGSAAYLRMSVSVTDIATDPRWAKYKSLALSLGLRACWSSPICADDGAIRGVVAFYYDEVRGPKTDEREAMAICLDLSRLAFQRDARVAAHERRVNIDSLTGLPNRTAFKAALGSVACDEPGQWGMFIIDLDNLKTVNDTFGHQTGDALIEAAGRRIAMAVAPDVIFRVGGDEFAVIVQSHEALSDLDETAVRVFKVLEQPADCDGNVVVPCATIGGAVLEAGDDADRVYQNADFALYHAKETGRGGFVRYWPGIGTRITHRRKAIDDVSSALADERIDAFYQPIVRLDTGEIVGVEALCRLRTPAGEIVAAERFQDATSDAHVATALTDRMLSVVAQDISGWLAEGIPFQHAGINISTADFYAGDLAHKIETSFGAAGVSLDHMILEVREGVCIGRRDKVVERQIASMREQGLLVALDDFGTGYASLTHLLNMPADFIKIDRSFIARLRPGDPSMTIVQGLIDITRDLGIGIVAEGIEAGPQASQLWSMGCRLGQGFAFSRAVDRETMTLLLRSHAQGREGVTPLYPAPVSPDDRRKALSA